MAVWPQTEHNNAVCVPLTLMKAGKEISLQNVIQYIPGPIPYTEYSACAHNFLHDDKIKDLLLLLFGLRRYNDLLA